MSRRQHLVASFDIRLRSHTISWAQYAPILFGILKSLIMDVWDTCYPGWLEHSNTSMPIAAFCEELPHPSHIHISGRCNRRSACPGLGKLAARL